MRHKAMVHKTMYLKLHFGGHLERNCSKKGKLSLL